MRFDPEGGVQHEVGGQFVPQRRATKHRVPAVAQVDERRLVCSVIRGRIVRHPSSEAVGPHRIDESLRGRRRSRAVTSSVDDEQSASEHLLVRFTGRHPGCEADDGDDARFVCGA